MSNMKTMDGNTAAAYTSYAFTEVAAIYPITPSSPMAELVDDWSARGRKNIFGQPVKVVEMQSEGGASGALHGSLASGALTSTYTASQGLLLMIPNMYKISGELLPGVMHVTARALASHALSIFGDQADVMSTRQTGFAMLASASVQEVMDLAAVAHLAAIKGRVPFLHFFDGFRTSHEIQKIETLDYDELKKLVDMDAVKEFRHRALNPEHPVVRGSAQNPDIYFQAREAANRYYEAVPEIVIEYMKEIEKLTGRKYNPFDYVGAEDAEYVVVAMGSVCEAIEETIERLVKAGKKVGLIKVRLYRPFVKELFLGALPDTVKKIAVLDRTKEPGAFGEPLYEEIKAVLYGSENAPQVIGGRYGLGSKDVTPGMIEAVYKNLESTEPKDDFTIGINDDVTNKSLEYDASVTGEPEGTIRCMFWGLGSDGTVGANKTAIKIIGDNTDMYAQGYFAYDSKKSGGVTISHLRFGKERIKSTYLINNADFVACHNQAYLTQYDMLKNLKEGGTFLLNTTWEGPEIEANIPGAVKRELAQKKAKLYTINAVKIAEEIGLGHRINMVMQAAFFKLSKVLNLDDAVKYLKEGIDATYGRKGQNIVDMNCKAVDMGINALSEHEVPAEWIDAKDDDKINDVSGKPEFITKILEPMNKQEGDSLPVSLFKDRADGEFPTGTTQYEKRGVAVNVPTWRSETCIQCNQCAFVCPHACIRPVLVDADEKAKAPSQFKTEAAKGKGFEGLEFRMQVSPLDCLGCGSCAHVCPTKEKSLVMTPLADNMDEKENWEYAMEIPEKDNIMEKTSVKGSQFAKPYLEFSGACAGCGETPYIKVVTQLFGDRMVIANATGCSSIWGASAPSMPYCKDRNGKGPAWANSLFEDNAEYGLGIATGIKQIRARVKELLSELASLNISKELKDAISAWIENMENSDVTRKVSDDLAKALKAEKVSGGREKELVDVLIDLEDQFVKKSVWSVGGDGWAYDIGYGGLDHVLASGENINVLVFDTEVYSNTGGQASKATPTAAVAKFASAGKRIKKKDLAKIAMAYGYVYVAQVGMGADKNQFMKAIKEAEAYDGPSIIICYAPCISHGIKTGMSTSQTNIKEAVDCGYWHLFRYNPLLEEQGKNPFVLDSKQPKESFREFLMGQVRYESLKKAFPDVAEGLFEQTEREAKKKYEDYAKMAGRSIE